MSCRYISCESPNISHGHVIHLLLSFSLLRFAHCLQDCVRRRKLSMANKLRSTFRYKMARGRIP